MVVKKKTTFGNITKTKKQATKIIDKTKFVKKKKTNAKNKCHVKKQNKNKYTQHLLCPT